MAVQEDQIDLSGNPKEAGFSASHGSSLLNSSRQEQTKMVNVLREPLRKEMTTESFSAVLCNMLLAQPEEVGCDLCFLLILVNNLSIPRMIR